MHVPVALTLQYITAAVLVSVVAMHPMSSVPPDTWDAEAFGRGRLPNIDDELLPLEWGQLQVLHTTDIHGCVYMLTGVSGTPEALTAGAELQRRLGRLGRIHATHAETSPARRR